MTKRNLEFLYEVGALRFIKRSWIHFLNPDVANLAEHHLRVMWLALVISRTEKNVDTEKMIKMALVHDVAESRTGDADYLSRQYVKRNEEEAIKDILKDTSLEEEFLQLWEEYEKKACIEAKIVKDADNLDVDLELQEQKAKGAFSKELEKGRILMADQLYTRTAKKIFKEIKASNPHDWHLNSRHRFSQGKWSK